MGYFNNYGTAQGWNVGMAAGSQPLGYNRPVAKPKMNTGISEEERRLLVQEQELFDLNVTPKQMAFAACAHKTPDGASYTVTRVPGAEPGTLQCKTCGAIFNLDVMTPQYVEQAVNMILNTLQSVKLLGIDLSNEVIRQYFSMIPYLERLPLLYKMVTKTFDRYQSYIPTDTVGGPNVISLYQDMLSGSTPLYGGPAATGWSQPTAPPPVGGWGAPKTDIYGRPIDDHGRLIDRFGRLVNENGHLINEYGRLVNEYGQLVDEYDRPIQQAPVEPQTSFTNQAAQMTSGANPMYAPSAQQPAKEPMNQPTPGSTVQTGETKPVTVQKQLQL